MWHSFTGLLPHPLQVFFVKGQRHRLAAPTIAHQAYSSRRGARHRNQALCREDLGAEAPCLSPSFFPSYA